MRVIYCCLLLFTVVNSLAFYDVVYCRDHDYLLAARVGKLKVTMISWSCNDRFIITAANDTAVRIWDSNSLSLIHMLKVCDIVISLMLMLSVSMWSVSHLTFN